MNGPEYVYKSVSFKRIKKKKMLTVQLHFHYNRINEKMGISVNDNIVNYLNRIMSAVGCHTVQSSILAL